jgi:hypothetical protein
MIKRASDWVPRDSNAIHENVLLVQPYSQSNAIAASYFEKAKLTGVHIVEQEVGSATSDDDELLLAGASHIEMSNIPISR